MIPLGSMGPGPSRDPKEPIDENETFFQAFGFEVCFAGAMLLLLLITGMIGMAMDRGYNNHQIQQTHVPLHLEKN